MTIEMPTTKTLEAITDAFNRHDVDGVMAFFAEDAVFESPKGPEPWGRRFVGRDEVREGFAARFAGIPDVHYGDDRHWAGNDFGVSEWTLTGTSVSGQRIEVRGIDMLEFVGGKIVRKDSFWKIRE